MNLYLFADGVTVAQYLVDTNGLRPTQIIFRTQALVEQAQYLNPNDDNILLFVIQGCTTIKVTDAITLLNKVHKLHVFKKMIVYTNIPLIGYTHPYILYSNDIFSGCEAYIKDINGTLNSKQITALLKQQKQAALLQICNAPEYRATKCTVIGYPNVSREKPKDTNELSITVVDLFK